MSVLYGPSGEVIRRSSDFKKADPPKLGEIAQWAGTDQYIFQLPGGAVLQFNLNMLTLDDYRAMRDHYQVNSNLTLLTFMLHQQDWRVVCENQKIADFLEEVMRSVWTRLIRAISQSFWAGYSPNILEYENDVEGRRVILNKVKDLVPEDCTVNWKEVEGWAPPGKVKPKIRIYDGIKRWGAPYSYPPENTFWYALLMENGNYYGKKLLRPAFPSWFFSILLHLFANRYYERFGEPVPIGRADFGDTVTIGGVQKSGDKAMEDILRALRSRSVVVLPSERQQVGTQGATEYVYDIEYLESQLRGADFERYMARLDEEISLSLFTPVLLLRTADVGSYNLGVGHMQLFMWMLNALSGDIKEYIDRYILRPLKDFNFGVNAPKALWQPKQMGKQNIETIRAIVTEMMRGNRMAPDVEQLGEAVGLTLKEVREVTEPPDEPDEPGDGDEPEVDPRNGTTGRPERSRTSGPRGPGQPRSTQRDISARVRGQVEKAFRTGSFGKDFRPSIGYRNRLQDEGVKNVDRLFDVLDLAIEDMIKVGFDTPNEFMTVFDKFLDTQMSKFCAT